MGLFRKLWPERSRVLPPHSPCCDVYYQRDRILIAAQHRDDSGFAAIGKPLAVLPINATREEIGAAILAALDGSRDGLTAHEAAAQISQALESVDVLTWDALEAGWSVIKVGLQHGGQFVSLGAMHRYSTGGYVSLEGDPVYRCSLEAADVGEIARTIIDGPALETVRHLPSHS